MVTEEQLCRTDSKYISHEAVDYVLKRQKYKCNGCGVWFGPPNPVDYYAKLKKPRNEGGGYHSENDKIDFDNIYVVCGSCYEEATKAEKKSFYIHKEKLKIYERWMDNNNWTKKNGKHNLSRLVRLGLESLTDSEWFEPLIGEMEEQVKRSEEYVHSFIDLMQIYNDSKGDGLDFAHNAAEYFKNYVHSWEKKETDEEIDAKWEDKRLRKLLKDIRDREIQIILTNKSNGWGNYSDISIE